MSRTRFFVVVALTALAVFLGRMGWRWAGEITRSAISQQAPGRLQLVLDEQDVGLVRAGIPLAVTFAIANTGPGNLSIQQASEIPYGNEDAYRTVTIKPGQTGEVVALLTSDDLLDRGQKHILFTTSDPTSPELWLTVRGTVIRTVSGGE